MESCGGVGKIIVEENARFWDKLSLGRNRTDEGGDPADALKENLKDDVYPSNELELREKNWQADVAKKAALPSKTKSKGAPSVTTK